MRRGLVDDPEVALRVGIAVVDRRRACICSATAFTVANASNAPAAPIMWPVIDFVPEIASDSRAVAIAEDRPDRLRLALVAERRRRPVRVDQVDLVGRHAAPLEGHLHRPGRAVPPVDRLDHVPAVGRRAVADDLGVDPRAARLGQFEVLEEQRARALAEDEPVARRVERARDGLERFARPRQPIPRMFVKPAWAISSSGASVEPLITAMQSPRRIASAPSATLWVPVAQADTMQMLWPIAPVSIAIIPDVESTRALAMNVGGDAFGPFSRSGRSFDHQLLAAGPRAEHDADVGPVGIVDLEPGVGERLLRGRDAVVHLALAAPDRLRIHPLRRRRSRGPRRRPCARSARCRSW